MSRGYKNAINSPRNTHEKEQVDLTVFIASVLHSNLKMPNAAHFKSNFILTMPQQPPTSISCGVYVCATMEKILQSLPVDFSYEWIMKRQAVYGVKMFRDAYKGDPLNFLPEGYLQDSPS